MGRSHAPLYALNAGGVDPEALTRVDLEKMRVAAEHPVENFLPRALGPITIFPGSEMLGPIAGNAETRLLQFWRDRDSTTTAYMLLLSPGEMRVVDADGATVTVPAVSTSISSVAWTDESDGAATASVSSGALRLTATSSDRARLRQSRTILTADQGTPHVLKVEVTRGPVYVRIGTTAGGAELMSPLSDAELDDGTHFLEFTPSVGTIYIDVSSADPSVLRTVASIQFNAAGELVVPHPWETTAELSALRAWQSLDVIFAGTGTRQQQRIENRGSPRSWGVAAYKTSTGPFLTGSRQITMTPDASRGNAAVAASEQYFIEQHVGALLELTHVGRYIDETLSGAEESTDFITVIGVNNGRWFYVKATGTSFVGTLVLERSFEPSDPTTWSEWDSFVNAAATFSRYRIDDNQDNITVHYRFRVSAYTSGSVAVEIEYAADSSTGVARITDVTSSTSAQIEVLTTFGNVTPVRTWRIGAWSDLAGWPRTPVIQDARLHWFRADTDFASVVDDYNNFDDTVLGDSGPITRSIGSGGGAGVRWALSADRLLVGTARAEAVVAASELDGALTPTEYTVRRPTRRGSADVAAVAYDDGVVFLHRSAKRLYKMIRGGGGGYATPELTRLNAAALQAGGVRIAVQQQPELRFYVLTTAGELVICTHHQDEELAAITTRTISGGLIEDIEVLPGDDYDAVYMVVNRNGTRYLERFAPEESQKSKDTCALLDAHKVLTGAVTQITGATHLAGQTVQVWADGLRLADVTLDGSGTAALSGGPYARVVYGLPYTAKWKSVKLEHSARLGTAIGQPKQVRGAALVLHNSCMDGVRIGPSFDRLEALPTSVNGADRAANQFFAHHEMEVVPIDSAWLTDARFCVQVTSGDGPVTIQGLVLDIDTRDGADE